MSRRAAAIALGVLVLVHAAVAWYPFRLDVPASVPVEVERLDAGGLELGGRRIVAEGLPPWTGVDLAEIEAVVVNLLIRPAAGFQSGPARILTNSDGYHDANLMIGQERDNLVVRVRRPGSDAAGNPPLVVPRAFEEERWTRVRVVAGRQGILAEVEGVGRHEIPVDSPPMPTWDPTYPVFIGDERVGDRVWHGQVAEAVMTADGRALNYLAPATLRIPERVWYVPDRLQEPFGPPDTGAQLRSVLHLLAFLPVGALLVLARRRETGSARRRVQTELVTAFAAAAAFAVALQLGKVVLEGRHPSPWTVLAQTVGAVAGAALLLWLAGRDARVPAGAEALSSGHRAGLIATLRQTRDGAGSRLRR